MGKGKDVRTAVGAELDFDPLIDSTDISVINIGGDVTLAGTVPSYRQYLEAAAAAQRVAGVTNVHNNLMVVLPDSDYRDDARLTTAANNALAQNVTVPDGVEAVSDDGNVTLTGTVPYLTERAAAEDAVTGLAGVRNVRNDIEISYPASPSGHRLKRIAVEGSLAVTVETDGVTLPGDLVMPDAARGVVVFAHGSGSSRFSPRNLAVAGGLTGAGFGTLLFDLLTGDEERTDAATGELRFDVGLLGRRLTGAIDWLDGQDRLRGLPRGLFGASTGAAAALVTAAERPARVHAVVSRGGRPDLAGAALGRVRAPVLLIVGGRDPQVLELNEAARAHLPGISELAVVPGATHLFEEPGALDQVTALAARWFTRHLA